MRRHSRLLKLVLLAGMFASISSPLHAQTTPTLQWDANTETNLAGYRVYQGTQSGVYGPTPVDVGNVTSYRPQGVDWTHRAYFAVQAYNTSAGVSPLSTEAVWVPASITTFTGLTSSSPYPLVPGVSVTWTATASNNLGPVEYRFYMYKKTAWVMVRDYAPSNTYTWTPNGERLGDAVLFTGLGARDRVDRILRGLAQHGPLRRRTSATDADVQRGLSDATWQPDHLDGDAGSPGRRRGRVPVSGHRHGDQYDDRPPQLFIEQSGAVGAAQRRSLHRAGSRTSGG